jgi:AraC-like DNA-binding protein
VFQCPVLFNEPVNQMLLEDRLLDISLPFADPSLSELLDHHAQRLLKRLPIEDGFLSELRRVLSEGLSAGDVRLTTTARKLAVSRRALQRVLTGQGTSYKAILDRMRYELAAELMRESGIDVEEIARFLGFSSSRSFYRAFKRWTGETPREFRQRPTGPSSTILTRH